MNAGTEYLKSKAVYQLLVCYHSVASSAYIFQSTFQKLDNGSALWLNHNLENISMYLQNWQGMTTIIWGKTTGLCLNSKESVIFVQYVKDPEILVILF